jgi:hypothetical protein
MICHECHIEMIRIDGIPTCYLCGKEYRIERGLEKLGITHAWHSSLTNAPSLPLTDKHKAYLDKLFSGAIGGLDR